MGKIVTFINEKGGVGKTTIIFNMSWYLADKKKKVLIVDLDAQRGNISFLANVPNRNRCFNVLEILQDRCDKEDALKSIKENLDIIPGNSGIAALSEGTAKLLPFRKLLKDLADKYDYVFIDVSPTPNWGHILALFASDYVLIPVNPETLPLEGVKGIKETLDSAIEGGNSNLKVIGEVINESRPTNLGKMTPGIVQQHTEQLGCEMFKATIRRAEEINKAEAVHVGITEFSPKSEVSKDVIALTEEFERRIEADGQI